MKFYLTDNDDTFLIINDGDLKTLADLVNETYKRTFGFYLGETDLDLMRRKAKAIGENLEALKDEAILEGMRSRATIDGKPMKDQYVIDALEVSKATVVLLDVDMAYDEFYLCYNMEKYRPSFLPNSCCHIEVVTKEIAEENDREYLRSSSDFTKEDLANYKVGEILSEYRKLGNSEFYFKFM